MATILRRSSRLAQPLAQGIHPEATNLPNSGPVQATVIPSDTPLLVSMVPEQRPLPGRRDSAESTRTEPRTTLSDAELNRLAAIIHKGSDYNNNNNVGSPSSPHSHNKSKRASASDVCSNLFRLIGLLFLRLVGQLFLGDGCVNLAASIFFLISAFTLAYRGSEAVASVGTVVLSAVTFVRSVIGTPWLELLTPTKLLSTGLSYVAPLQRSGTTSQITLTEVIASTLLGVIAFLPLQWAYGKKTPMKLLSLLSGVLITLWASLSFAISTDPQCELLCPPTSPLATFAVGAALLSMVLCVIITGFFATSALRWFLPQTPESNRENFLDYSHLAILKMIDVVNPLVDPSTSLHGAGLESKVSQSRYNSRDDKVTNKSPVRFSEPEYTHSHDPAPPSSSDNDLSPRVEHANVLLARAEDEHPDPRAASSVSRSRQSPSTSPTRRNALQERLISAQVEQVMGKLIPINPEDIFVPLKLIENLNRMVALLSMYLPETRSTIACIVFPPMVISELKKTAALRSWGATTAMLANIRENDLFDPIELCGALTSDLEPWETFVQDAIVPLLSKLGNLRDPQTVPSLGEILTSIYARGRHVGLDTSIAVGSVALRTPSTMTAGTSILNAMKEHCKGLYDIVVRRLCHDGPTGDHFRNSDSMQSVAVGVPLAVLCMSIADLMDSINEATNILGSEPLVGLIAPAINTTAATGNTRTFKAAQPRNMTAQPGPCPRDLPGKLFCYGSLVTPNNPLISVCTKTHPHQLALSKAGLDEQGAASIVHLTDRRQKSLTIPDNQKSLASSFRRLDWFKRAIVLAQVAATAKGATIATSQPFQSATVPLVVPSAFSSVSYNGPPTFGPFSSGQTQNDFRTVYGTTNNKAPANTGMAAKYQINSSMPADFLLYGNTLVAASLTCNEATFGPHYVSDLLAVICPASRPDDTKASVLEPSLNQLPNGRSFTNYTTVNVNGFDTYALLDSGCSMAVVSRHLINKPGPNPWPGMSIELTKRKVKTHALGSIIDAAQIASVRFQTVNSDGKTIEVQCDAIVVDVTVPGFDYGMILPLAHSKKHAINLFVEDTAPYLPFSGSSASAPIWSITAPVLLSDSDEVIATDMDAFETISNWYDLLTQDEQSTPTALAVNALVRNILLPDTESNTATSGYHPKGTKLTAADVDIHPSASQFHKDAVLALLQTFNDKYGIFGPPDLNAFPPVPIDTLPDSSPYNDGRFNADKNLTLEQRAQIRRMFRELIELGFLEVYDEAKHGPVEELWIHSYLPVEKHTEKGVYRPVIDYRRLNKVTVPEPCHTQTSAIECTRAMAGQDVYILTDALKYYNAFRLRRGDGIKAAIRSPLGILIPNVMGMGMMNSSYFAQKNTDTWTEGFAPWEKMTTPDATSCIAVGYVDDIAFGALASKNSQDPFAEACSTVLESFATFLDRVGKSNGRLSLKKSKFLYPCITFIGTKLSKTGREMSPENLQGLVDLGAPTKPGKDGLPVVHMPALEHVVGFFGWLASYCPTYHDLMRNLQVALTFGRANKATPIPWTHKLQSSFDITKQTLARNHPLAVIDTRYPIVLHSDCSSVAMGAMLLTGPPEDLKVVGFFSKTLSSTQQAYDASSRELLGIKTAIQHFNPLIVAHAHRGQRLIIASDHFNLSCWGVFNSENNTFASRRIRNWYDYLETAFGAAQGIIVYRAGINLQQADALSRNAPQERSTTQQIQDYLAQDLPSLVAATHAVCQARHNAALQAYVDAPMDYPENFREHLDKAQPSLEDTNYAVHAHRFATAMTYSIHKDVIPEGFSTPASILGEGVPPPLTHSGTAIIASAMAPPDVTSIFQVANTDFPRLLALHQKTAAAQTELISLRKHNKYSFQTKVVDNYALHTVTRADGIEAFWIPTDDSVHKTQDILLTLAHQSAAAHYAAERTYGHLLDGHVWWKSMRKDSAGYSKTCLECDRIRGPVEGYEAQGTITSVNSSRFNELILIDVVGPFPNDSGYRYIFVVVDHFTGFTTLHPAASNDQKNFKSALESWFAVFGWPKLVYTDGAKNLVAKAVNDTLSANGVAHAVATAYHAASVGQVERRNADVLHALQKLCALTPNHWTCHLATIQRALNSVKSSTRGVSADQAVFLTPPRSSVRLFTNEEAPILGITPQQLCIQAKELNDHITDLISTQRSAMQKEFEATFRKHNKDVVFTTGQRVWVAYPGPQKLFKDIEQPQMQRTTKLSPRRQLGVVISQDGNNYEVELFRVDENEHKFIKTHVNRLSSCNADITGLEAELVSRGPGTPAPERVLGHRGTNSKDLHYLIKWLSLPDQYNTVEPHSFTALNGKVFTIGDTLVVQKYLTENKIDAYNTEVNKTPSPPDPDVLVPDAHAPAPLDGRQEVFKATDVAYSRATNDYVKVLQRLLPGTEDETYSVLGRDGFVIKVAPKVLLHPAQALELKLASPFDDFKDPVPAVVLKPTEVEVNPELKTKSILQPAHVTVSERNKANAKIRAKLQEQEKAGDLPRPKYEEGQTVYHVATGQAGLIVGPPSWYYANDEAFWGYPIKWSQSSTVFVEEEPRLTPSLTRVRTTTKHFAPNTPVKEHVPVPRARSTKSTSKSKQSKADLLQDRGLSP